MPIPRTNWPNARGVVLAMFATRRCDSAFSGVREYHQFADFEVRVKRSVNSWRDRGRDDLDCALSARSRRLMPFVGARAVPVCLNVLLHLACTQGVG